MPRSFKTENVNADARAQQVVNLIKNNGGAVKSTFDRKRWKDAMHLVITGYDFCFDENALNAILAQKPLATADEIAQELRSYPIFKTTLVMPDGTQKPYDNLWLSTLLRPVEDSLGDEHVPNGTFNVLAREKFDMASTDEEALKAIFDALTSKKIKCVRQKAIKRDYYGRTRTEKLLEFDVE